MEWIMIIITAVAAPLLVKTYEWWLKKRQGNIDKGFAEHSKYILPVEKKLAEMLEILGCDRVWLSLFHNGGVYYGTNVSIKKFSIFFERRVSFIASIKNNFKDVPITNYLTFFDYMNNEGIFVSNDFHNDKKTKDLYLYEYADNYGVKSTVYAAIKSMNNKYIGNLGVEFIQKKHTFTDEEITLVNECVDIIGGFLDAFLMTKKSLLFKSKK